MKPFMQGTRVITHIPDHACTQGIVRASAAGAQKFYNLLSDICAVIFTPTVHFSSFKEANEGAIHSCTDNSPARELCPLTLLHKLQDEAAI